jgi:hypothetical protein
MLSDNLAYVHPTCYWWPLSPAIHDLTLVLSSFPTIFPHPPFTSSSYIETILGQIYIWMFCIPNTR